MTRFTPEAFGKVQPDPVFASIRSRDRPAVSNVPEARFLPLGARRLALNAITRQIRAELEAALASIDDEHDARAIALQLATLIERLEARLVTLLDTSTGPTLEERLYARTATDYAQFQQQLAPVRRAVVDRSGLVSMLRGKGHDLESTKQYIALAGILDGALQQLVNLLQYDTVERQEIDLRDGYRITSGSATVGRFYFAPPNRNSGN